MGKTVEGSTCRPEREHLQSGVVMQFRTDNERREGLCRPFSDCVIVKVENETVYFARPYLYVSGAESVPVPLAGVERFEASVDRVLEDGGMFSTVMCYDGPKKFLTTNILNFIAGKDR